MTDTATAPTYRLARSSTGTVHAVRAGDPGTVVQGCNGRKVGIEHLDLSDPGTEPTCKRCSERFEPGDYAPPAPPAPRGRREPSRPPLAALVDAGLLPVGNVLSGRYKGQDLVAVVEADGRLVHNGERHKSPSGAAVAAKQGVTGEKKMTDGWGFWRLTDGRSLADLRADLNA